MSEQQSRVNIATLNAMLDGSPGQDTATTPLVGAESYLPEANPAVYGKPEAPAHPYVAVDL